jgi:hypothetical protein
MPTHGPQETLPDTVSRIYATFDGQRRKAIDEMKKRRESPLASLMETRSNWIFLNDPLHTLKLGKVYIIGLNPGGSDSVSNQSDAPESREWWEGQQAKRARPYSCYLDEKWPGVFQAQIKELLDHYGTGQTRESRIGSSFCTNLYFFRTPHAENLHEYPQELVDCWEYHKEFLKIVQPELLICIGNNERFSAYAKFKGYAVKEGGVSRELTRRRIALAKRFVKAFSYRPRWLDKGGDALVVGIPHLSYPVAMPALIGTLDATIAEYKASLA